jgi:hypothetical protein
MTFNAGRRPSGPAAESVFNSPDLRIWNGGTSKHWGELEKMTNKSISDGLNFFKDTNI